MNGDTFSGLDLGPTIRDFAADQVVFERYRLDRILGRGGMGVVWLAHDQELGEDIAFKFLPEAVRLDALAFEELKRETRKSRKLTHRNIVRVYNFVSDANCAGITMEWIDGSPLSALRLSKPNRVFEPEELQPWVKQICEALEYAHGVAKLIHRDLKPANIMLSGAGEAKITDFGISSSLTESASRVSAQSTASGTLAYMSPQQALGERPMPVDDVYSLGATLYELISGKPPFFRGDLYAQIRDVVPPPMAERRAEADIPADGISSKWEETIAACLSKDPNARPQSAMEVAWLLGLVKDYDRKTPAGIPRPEVIRVPQEQRNAAVAKPATAAWDRITDSVKSFTSARAADTATGERAAPGTTTGAAPPEPTRRSFFQKYGVHFAAAILVVALLWVTIRHFAHSRISPIAVNATPAPTATPAPAPTVTPAPAVTPAPTIAPTPTATPTPIPAASAVAVIETPTATPALPVVAPSPSYSGTQGIPEIDHQLVGKWQTGTTAATRTRWELQPNGQYTLTVSGTIADSGTMSATDGQIEEFSENNPQPAALTYQLTDGVLVTTGSGPFDGARWHKLTTTRSTHHTDTSSQSGGGIGHKIGSALKRIF